MNTETTISNENEPAGTNPEGFHLLVMSPDMFISQPLPAFGAVRIGRSSKCDVQVDDPRASREHAHLHIEASAGSTSLSIEDLGSANGTFVRDAAIRARERVSIPPGEAVIIGSTVLMALQNRAHTAPRRLWGHGYFEARVEEECVRADKNDATFALGRVRFTGPAPWTKIIPVLAREVGPPHVFAKYGPRDYEVLFLDTPEAEVDRILRRLSESCRAADLEASWGLAWYPRNGRTGDALLAAANALLKVHSGRADRGAAEPAAMERVRGMAARAASSPINVLILGECGVGKEVLAALIHGLSPRAGKPFVALNCAGLSETLMDSELFGYEKGAFTGAGTAKMGLLESANGGTVFLDEIGDMPLSMQAKLLRVIEAREVRPVGSLKSRAIDVRVLSATNKDLEEAVGRGDFRLDLMHRLNGLTLAIPPLRERLDEIPALVTTFVAAASRDLGRPEPLAVRAEVLDWLLRYRWPGNIRELKNMMERAVTLCEGDEIGIEHLPLDKMRGSLAIALEPVEPAAPTMELAKKLPKLTDPAKEADRRRIVDALVAFNGNQSRAAESLGMSRGAFITKLEQYGIPRPQKGPPRESSSAGRRSAAEDADD